MTEINGHAEDGWGPVADAFSRNFEAFGELGAACCVYVEGRPVIDLWGGIADRRTGRRWEEDTIAVVCSTTKGATAICAHMLAERGQLDLDECVATYWPEFGAEGKEGIRVRWLLSHQAGLPTVEMPLTLEEACAWQPAIRALEKQKPSWEPGTHQAYHAWTYGFLVGEVVRRVTGKTVGSFFADEVAKPLALDSWIGLPDEMEPRVAHLTADSVCSDPEALLDAQLAKVVSESIPVPPGARAALLELWADPNAVDVRAGRLSGAFPPQLVTEDGGLNLRTVRAAEHPGSNMVSDARSIARMYAATIGDVDGLRLLQPHTVEEMCVLQPAPPYGIPPDLRAFMAEAFPMGVSLGFMRPTRLQPLLGPRSFGHRGAGGSLAFADPDCDVSFGYVMNRMASGETTNNLVAAVADCIM